MRLNKMDRSIRGSELGIGQCGLTLGRQKWGKQRVVKILVKLLILNKYSCREIVGESSQILPGTWQPSSSLTLILSFLGLFFIILIDSSCKFPSLAESSAFRSASIFALTALLFQLFPSPLLFGLFLFSAVQRGIHALFYLVNSFLVSWKFSSFNFPVLEEASCCLLLGLKWFGPLSRWYMMVFRWHYSLSNWRR